MPAGSFFFWLFLHFSNRIFFATNTCFSRPGERRERERERASYHTGDRLELNTIPRDRRPSASTGPLPARSPFATGKRLNKNDITWISSPSQNTKMASPEILPPTLPRAPAPAPRTHRPFPLPRHGVHARVVGHLGSLPCAPRADERDLQMMAV